jgi:DnaJ-class molecular chaperone
MQFFNLDQRRAIYDQYGIDGLKKGVPGREDFDGYAGGYSFHGNAELVFLEFFGSKNPFVDFFATQQEQPFGAAFGGLHGMANSTFLKQPVKQTNVDFDLNLTLEELYLGCQKKFKISPKIINDDGMTTRMSNKILTIQVPPGTKSGTRFIFPKQGDQGPNIIPGDVVFTVKEIKHDRFKRLDNDLVLEQNIPLFNALTGYVIDVHTLDGRMLKIPINEMIT